MAATPRGALALALVASFALACSSPPERPAGSAPGSSRGRPDRGVAVPEAVMDLEAMLSPVPEYQGSGRNLFAFGAARSAGLPTTEPVPENPRVAPPPVLTAPVAPPTTLAPPARLGVKYAGFLEKTESDGEKAKYAIFLDGNEILAGAEGETVANRFKVVEIGLESVTVSTSGTNVTQRIPLQSN